MISAREEYRPRIPLWVKVSYSLFTGMIVSLYWIHLGPVIFLWFSYIALLMTLAALWLESRFLASMTALAVLLPELGWNMGFLVRLITGWDPFNIYHYIFAAGVPYLLRLIPLFHVPLPLILIWLLIRWGYDGRALFPQIFFSWVVFPITFVLTPPEQNINWVYGLGGHPQSLFSPVMFLIVFNIAVPLVIYVPTHFILKGIFGRSGPA